MEDSQGTIALVIPIVAIAGWLLYAIVAVVMRSRIRELEVRARIAMIEKGMVPPPERDPGEFEKAMNSTHPADASNYRQYRAYKLRSAGITMVAVGLGLTATAAFGRLRPSATPTTNRRQPWRPMLHSQSHCGARIAPACGRLEVWSPPKGGCG